MRSRENLRRKTQLILTAVCAFAANTADAETPRKPAALKPGDTIMVVAPSGELVESRVRLAVKRLEEKGYRVVVPGNLFRQRGYLAGTDQQRADELMRAFLDPEVDAIFPGTGGYGLTRVLDLLDWDAIRAHPKIVVGFSDITALHLALAAKANLVTFHSPNPQWGLGSEENLPDFSAKYFWRNLIAESNRGAVGFEYNPPAESGPLVSIAGGSAQGRLTGGNLSLVAALVGTPYAVQTKGRVLFLEDVREAPYRVDRMLSQLRLAGHLDGCAAVLLGQFSRCEPDQDEDSLTLDEVFDDYFADAPYPVIKNFPAGHVKLNATLPFGVLVEVDAGEPKVRVLENPVSTD